MFQVLENKFNEFYTELTTIGQGRVDELFVGGDSLLENNHTMSPDIQVSTVHSGTKKTRRLRFVS